MNYKYKGKISYTIKICLKLYNQEKQYKIDHFEGNNVFKEHLSITFENLQMSIVIMNIETIYLFWEYIEKFIKIENH